MAELTPAADRYISAMLGREGRVPLEALDWVPEHERAELLQQYASAHAADVPLRFEDSALVPAPPAPTPSVTPPTSEQPRQAVAAPASAAAPAPAIAARPADQPADAFDPDAFDPRLVLGEGHGKALLDSKPAGRPVSRWIYALPLFMGLVGGILGWLIVRDENPRGGRNVLMVGVVVTVVSFCMSFALAGTAISGLKGLSANQTAWPATGVTTGRPALYYFGTST